MATNRVTGVGVEVLNDGATPNARVTGLAAEVLNSGATTSARVTSQYIEVLTSTDDGPSGTNLAADLTDDSHLTANLTVEFQLAAALTDESVMSIDLSAHVPVNIGADLTDESVMSVSMTNEYELAASLTDESAMSVDLTVLHPINLSAALTDESVMSVAVAEIVGTGPFYFAWVDADETEFDGATMLRDDEDIFAFSLSQEEGDFATLTVTIKNPRIGLLNPARKVWAWLSWYTGSGVPRPLFFGRLVGVPNNVFDTQITIQFTARPLDFAAQKAALADSLRTLPWFDPIFIAPDSWEDLDVVLEARTASWHIDRITHDVTISDIIVPEDGVIELQETDHFRDGLQVQLQTVPLRRVTVNAAVPWTLTASGGGLDLSQAIVNAWPREDDDKYPQMISSFTFQGLADSWPKEGTKIGTGWVVQSGVLEDQSFLSVPEFVPPDYFDPADIPGPIPGGSEVWKPQITGVYYGGVDGAGFDETVKISVAAIGFGRPTLTVSYANSRSMQETISFTMVADMQAIVTLADDQDELVINVNANKVSDLSRDNTIPIGDLRSRTFADSPRGRQAVEHLVLIARANLIARSRAVQTTVQTDFETGMDMTLRKSLLVHDHRLPGGQALGKIVRYSLDMADGIGTASATIASTVGYGGSKTAGAGDPSYVVAGYVKSGYQKMINQVVVLPSVDTTYTMPPNTFFDDGVDFIRGLTAPDVTKLLVITNGPATQRANIKEFAGPMGDTATINTVLQQIPTQIHLKLRPLSVGPFAGTVPVSVSTLVIPKQIDLEAESNG